MRALIIAGGRNHRGSLTAARALASAGWLVGCGSTEKSSLVASSSATKHWHFMPPPERDLDAFLNAVQTAIEQVGYEVVLPSSDAETLALSFGRERIQARLPYPPHREVVRAFDKMELATGGQRAGLAVPETVLATDEELALVNAPITVKSRLHWTPGGTSSFARWETTIATGRSEAISRANQIREGGGEPLLQEVVHGHIVHCHVVIDKEGKLLTCVQQLSELLTWPPDAGTRVRSQTVAVDDELVQGVSSFLNDLDWFGFASLQFIKPDGERPQLIDFNGRVPQSFEQSIAAGPNLPALWACIASDRKHEPVPPVTVGVRYQWFEGDVHRALVERRGGLAHDLMDCLRYARGSVHGIWRRKDPLPAVNYWRHYLGRGVQDVVSKKRKKSRHQ